MALEKELSPDIYRLLKFGRMESGTVRNAVSGKTVLLGSLRAFQDEVFFGLQEGLRAIGRTSRRRRAVPWTSTPTTATRRLEPRRAV